MAFRRPWHATESPQALSAATQTHGWPARPSSAKRAKRAMAFKAAAASKDGAPKSKDSNPKHTTPEN